MEHNCTPIKIYPNNYYCIDCASLTGYLVDADYLIWDEEEQKAIPLCAECHGSSVKVGKFFDIFSHN